MMGCFLSVLLRLRSCLRSRAALQLEPMAIGPGHRQTRNCHCLVSARIPAALGVEESAPWPTGRSARGPEADSNDVGGEPVVGCTPDPWRTVETWSGDLSGQRRQVHDSRAAETFSDLADVSRESRGAARCR